MRCSFAGYYRGAADERWLIEDDLYLIKDHKPQEPALHKLRINIGELTARAHERGFDDLSDVETAVLYPNGTIYMKGGESTGQRPAERAAATGSSLATGSRGAPPLILLIRPNQAPSCPGLSHHFERLSVGTRGRSR